MEQDSIKINDIAVYLPEKIVCNIELARVNGKDEAFLKNRIGTNSIRQNCDGDGTVFLAEKAVRILLENNNLNPHDIDYLILITQNPDHGGLPHNSAILHGKLGLKEDCVCYDVSLGCSGYVYALDIAKAHMGALGKKCGVVITADPYSKIVEPSDYKSSLLFGDASTATLLTNNSGFQIHSSELKTFGSGWGSIVNNNGFTMNGKAVFKFTSDKVPECINEYVKKYSVENVDFYLIHQGSQAIISTIRKKLGLDVEKMPTYIHGIGNTVSSSIPILLSQYISNEKAKSIILCGFGVGLSIGTIRISR